MEYGALRPAPGFPRVVAHRGLSGLCPENTLPAFAAAVALGVDEIELDLWGSRDGELVVCHDDDVSRTSSGRGRIADMDWPALEALDAGRWFGRRWANVRMCRFDDILRHFAGQVVMNVHIKAPGEGGWIVRKVRDLAAAHGALDHTYIAGEGEVLTWALEHAPEIARCCLEGQFDMTLVDRAVDFRCQRVQFFTPHYTEEMIRDAHARGLLCNFFFANTPREADRLFRMGVDALLTDNANLVLPCARRFAGITR